MNVATAIKMRIDTSWSCDLAAFHHNVLAQLRVHMEYAWECVCEGGGAHRVDLHALLMTHCQF